MKIIEINNIHKYFGSGDNQVHVLKDINLTIEKGDFVSIIGKSGSGKTTLMNIIGCLDTPTTGSYKIFNNEISQLSSDDLARLRSKKFGFIFQRYNLLNRASAVDNVALPAIYAGVNNTTREERAKQLLDKLDLANKYDNKPNQLSGGQQQRVSIARALMNGGEIILADEPTGALDTNSGHNVMQILKELHQDGHTIIIVTHDPNIAQQANRVIEISDGIIINDTQKQEPNVIIDLEHEFIGTTSQLSYYKDSFLEAFNMSWQALISNKMRSLLTMLGIIIGIAAVISVVILGNSAKSYVVNQINSLGTNVMYFYPNYNGGYGRVNLKPFTISDLTLIKKQDFVTYVSPHIKEQSHVRYAHAKIQGNLNGVNYDYFAMQKIKLAKGRMFNKFDEDNFTPVIMIDKKTVARLFPKNVEPIGKIILYKNIPLQVIGIVEEASSLQKPTNDAELWMPYSSFTKRMVNSSRISSIIVQVNENIDSNLAEKYLTKLLISKHKSNKDFDVFNVTSIKNTISNVTAMLSLFISAVAFISLVVGGIGIMNIMLVSVTERTREIGIRMAIGARKYDILQQFLLESAMICFVGGLLGVVSAYILTFIISYLISNLVMTGAIFITIVALVFSISIGLFFGFMPARKASTLNPITALSQE